MEPSDWQRVDDGLRLRLLVDLEGRGSDPLDGTEGLTFYWLAWQQLGQRRTRGMAGPNPIAYSEIECWLDANEVRGDTREVIHIVLARLDGFYLDWIAKRLNAK